MKRLERIMRADTTTRILTTVAMAASLLLSSGCALKQSFGPRAPIIEGQEETVIDFIPEEEEIKAELAHRAGRAPLLPEYFDPFQPIVGEYVISRGDILEISIFGNSDTEVNEVVIAPDGKLYYLFLPGLVAEDKTIDELKLELEEAVSDYFVNPDVSIIPKRIANTTFNILGKVRRPGAYPIVSSLTLQQAIGEAGGISVGGYAGTTINSSNLRESFLIRDGKKMNVDFERLIFTDGSDQNIFVRPGDYIYIASSLVQEIFLLGKVREQKPIQYKDGLTLTAILAGVAGTTEGWTQQAHSTEVLIVRGSLDDPRAYQVNVLDILFGRARDVYLLPGDIVYVQPKPFKFGRELVRLAIQAFVTSFAGEAGAHFAEEHWFDCE